MINEIGGYFGTEHIVSDIQSVPHSNTEQDLCPTYWPELLELCEMDSVEYNLARKLLPLPIDQRYGEEDMQRIIDVILN